MNTTADKYIGDMTIDETSYRRFIQRESRNIRNDKYEYVGIKALTISQHNTIRFVYTIRSTR